MVSYRNVWNHPVIPSFKGAMVMLRLLFVIHTRWFAQFGVYLMFGGLVDYAGIGLFTVKYWVLLACFIILMNFHDWAITSSK